MSVSLIVPLCGDRPEYEYNIPYLFNFASDGTSLCIKAITGLDLSKFDNIYFVILKKLDEKYCLSELLNIQFRKMNLEKVRLVVLDNSTANQAETVYQTIQKENIQGSIFVKDADGYFTGSPTLCNSIAVYPLDKLEMVNPGNKSYVKLDDGYYITNIIEKKIIGRYFNAGGYIFEDASQFCHYYKNLSRYSRLYMSHLVYAMLLDGIPFRPFEVKDYQDWGNEKVYRYSMNSVEQ